MSASAPTVDEIAAALDAALATIEGLYTFPYLPDTFTPPVAVIEIEAVDYHGAFSGGDVVHQFTVFVIVSRSNDRTGAVALQGYMSQAGEPTSIQGALESDPTLGGVVSSLVVEKAGPVAPVTIAGSDVVYLSCPFTVHVHA